MRSSTAAMVVPSGASQAMGITYPDLASLTATADDLRANRVGSLSAPQRAMLEGNGQSWAPSRASSPGPAWSRASSPPGVCGTVVPGAANLCYVMGVLGYMLFMVLAIAVGGQPRRSGKPAAGPAAAHGHAAKKTDTSEWGEYYWLRVGDLALNLPREVFDAFTDGRIYRVYYVVHVNRPVISVLRARQSPKRMPRHTLSSVHVIVHEAQSEGAHAMATMNIHRDPSEVKSWRRSPSRRRSSGPTARGAHTLHSTRCSKVACPQLAALGGDRRGRYARVFAIVAVGNGLIAGEGWARCPSCSSSRPSRCSPGSGAPAPIGACPAASRRWCAVRLTKKTGTSETRVNTTRFTLW